MSDKLGVLVPLRAEGTLQPVVDYGLKIGQVVSIDYSLVTDEVADRLGEEAKRLGVKITSLWAGLPGPAQYNVIDGPKTIGLVPRQHRAERVEALKRSGDFAKRLGLPAIATHLGFVPETPGDPEYQGVVEAVREVAEYLKSIGLEFWSESGEETPLTLLRLMKDAGTGNIGVNLDPANLILYGRGNPIDALDVFGEYVREVHAKDGIYSKDPMSLGAEVLIGEGAVRFPEFIRKLKDIGYDGYYIIEREVSGEQRKKDILAEIEYLKPLLAD